LFAARQQARLLRPPLLRDREQTVDHLHVIDDAGLVLTRYCAEPKIVFDGLLGESAPKARWPCSRRLSLGS
jgi:hypothetical protein